METLPKFSVFSRFFTPTTAFWEWLIPLTKDRIVVDVGCGLGDLVMECEDHGISALGIDPCYGLFNLPVPTHLAGYLLPMAAEDCLDTLQADDVLLLCCRPCHDGFPITIVEAKRRSPFYYVGFEGNLQRDLGNVHLFPVLQDGAPLVAGGDGELVWEVGPRGT